MKVQLLLVLTFAHTILCQLHGTQYLQKLLKLRNQYFSEKNSQEYTVHYFKQKIDHLQFNSIDTFQQKYLIRDKYYKKGGPVLFYCGNEGPIEMFYENTGFLNDVLAEEFNALIVYMEHRYYGESMPFGTEEESYKKDNLIYLSSLQALYDYNVFLSWYKSTQIGDEHVPTVAFGGSYGGMLASWMRMKFPNVIDGALGASAPIVYFMNRKDLNLGSFYEIATVNYKHGECADVIKESFRRMAELEKSSSDVDLKMLSKTFNLCDPITKKSQISDLINWVDEGYSYMAMTNYPYPTEFLKSMPAWPANYSCNALENVSISSPNEFLFASIKNSVETFYNYKGTEKCNQIFDDSSQSDADMSGWNIQACGDMVMPMDSPQENNMFPPSQWDSKSYDELCYHQWGLYPQYDWALDYYGGKNDEEYSSYSNIFLSNGSLDPWAGGGVYYTNEANDFTHFLIYESAHHLDLRSPNPNDPPYVDHARKLEIEAIRRWINKKTKQNGQDQIEILI